MEVIMRRGFTHKHKALLTKGTISFVILSILAVVCLSSSLESLAISLAPSDIEQSFQDFCAFYYSDELADAQAVDVPNCQDISDSFASIIPENAQSQWPDQSLDQLALGGISSADDLQQVLLDAIDDPDQQALIN